jgi:hypothetical protein
MKGQFAGAKTPCVGQKMNSNILTSRQRQLPAKAQSYHLSVHPFLFHALAFTDAAERLGVRPAELSVIVKVNPQTCHKPSHCSPLRHFGQ